MNQTIQDTTQAFRGTVHAATEAARDLYYAGLGFFVMIEEEALDGFDALVREGRKAEQGRTKTLTAKAVAEVEEEARETRREVKRTAEQVEAFSNDLEARIVETVGTVLHRMNIPTRDDVEALKRSVERLNKKAVALRAS